MQYLLTRVKQLEDYARDLSKEISNLPPDADLQVDLKEDLITLIMSEKNYPAKAEQFQDWPLIALKAELKRIERIKNDPGMRRTTPNLSIFSKKIDDLTLEYKRKRAELVAAEYGTTRQIARWSKQNIDQTYRRLEELRKKDPTATKKPVYKTTDKPKQQVFTSEPLFTSSDTFALN
ncbi:hypothetical protein Hanom_Chr02g00149771 [Helianthus anomalus]